MWLFITRSNQLHYTQVRKRICDGARELEARSAAIETDGDDESQVPVECAVIAECVDAAGKPTRTNAALSSEEIGNVVLCPVLKRPEVGQTYKVN